MKLEFLKLVDVFLVILLVMFIFVNSLLVLWCSSFEIILSSCCEFEVMVKFMDEICECLRLVGKYYLLIYF